MNMILIVLNYQHQQITQLVLHAPAFNLNTFGLGLAEFINLGCDFNASSTASETATIIKNENEIKMK